MYYNDIVSGLESIDGMDAILELAKKEEDESMAKDEKISGLEETTKQLEQEVEQLKSLVERLKDININKLLNQPTGGDSESEEEEEEETKTIKTLDEILAEEEEERNG